MKRSRNPDHIRRVKMLPCICCRMAGETQTERTEAHHIRVDEHGIPLGFAQKAPDTHTIPLCPKHHWNGVHSQFTRAEFESQFGSELDLLAQTLIDLEGLED